MQTLIVRQRKGHCEQLGIFFNFSIILFIFVLFFHFSSTFLFLHYFSIFALFQHFLLTFGKWTCFFITFPVLQRNIECNFLIFALFSQCINECKKLNRCELSVVFWNYRCSLSAARCSMVKLEYIPVELLSKSSSTCILSWICPIFAFIKHSLQQQLQSVSHIGNSINALI